MVKSTLLISLDVGIWKVENLDDERSDENKNEVGRYRVVSPQKVSRFAPLNRYYIIIDEVFFDNFW